MADIDPDAQLVLDLIKYLTAVEGEVGALVGNYLEEIGTTDIAMLDAGQ